MTTADIDKHEHDNGVAIVNNGFTHHLEDDDRESKKTKLDNSDDKVFLSSLETKTGQMVDESTLIGKIVLLYFSASWCGDCKRSTALLNVLYDELKEQQEDEDDDNDNDDDNKCPPWELVWVSSDDTLEQYQTYNQKDHGNWLRIPFHSSLGAELKQKYQIFAGKEQSKFPTITRRQGIPSLVVIGRNGDEKVVLDCGNPKVLDPIEKQGLTYLQQWKEYAW